MRKGSRAFTGIGHRSRLLEPPAEGVPESQNIPRLRTEKVGGLGQRVGPRITTAPDAAPSPAYLQQVQERSAAARRQRDAQRQEAKQQVAEERRRCEMRESMAREAEARRGSLERMDAAVSEAERERVARQAEAAPAADAVHDMPAREQKFPLIMRMRDVKLGTWACTTGDDVVEVSWSKLQVKFRPVELNPSVNAGDKHEDLPLLKFRYEHIAKIELDYQRRAIRLRGQGQFGDKVDEDIYSPFGSPEAENSWLTMTFAGSAPEFTSSRSFLLKNVPDLKPKISVFNPTPGQDFDWGAPLPAPGRKRRIDPTQYDNQGGFDISSPEREIPAITAAAADSLSAPHISRRPAAPPPPPAAVGASPGAAAQQEKKKDFGEAIAYVTKVKQRFEGGAVYRSFLGILHTYQVEHTPLESVYEKISTLFEGHDDLIDGFSEFQPKGAAASSGVGAAKDEPTAADERKKKRRRIVKGGAGSDGAEVSPLGFAALDEEEEEDEVMVAAAPVLDAERAKTKALTEELGRLRREKAAAERAREEAENVLEVERAGRAEDQRARDAEKGAREAAEQALARARGEAPALRPLEVDALDALQAEALAAAGRIQQAAAEKRAEKYVCPVCMDKEKDVALDPCGHRVCAECAPSLNECPMCKQNVVRRMRLY